MRNTWCLQKFKQQITTRDAYSKVNLMTKFNQVIYLSVSKNTHDGSFFLPSLSWKRTSKEHEININ